MHFTVVARNMRNTEISRIFRIVACLQLYVNCVALLDFFLCLIKYITYRIYIFINCVFYIFNFISKYVISEKEIKQKMRKIVQFDGSYFKKKLTVCSNKQK